MARLNVELKWWGDTRRSKLILKAGNAHLADGAALAAWRMAQEYWRTGYGIPRKEFFGIDLAQALIDVGLADDNGDFIYVKGSKEHHEWLKGRSEAGRRGAAKTNAKRNGTSAAKADKRRPPPLSPSPSPSLSPAPPHAQEGKSSGGGSTPPRQEGVTVATWSAYSDAYQHRYGSAPVRNATVSGQLSNFVKRVGAEEAPRIAAFFVTHNDAFYLKAMHPVGLMLRDAEKLRTEWATGNRMTGTRAAQGERRQHNVDAFAAAAESLGMLEGE